MTKNALSATTHNASHPMSPRVVADLRTDHAGETGAVWIYKGILFTTRDEGIRAFAVRHLKTEATHLRQIQAWLAPADHSLLLPIWRVAGWFTGAVPALVGPGAVYATVQAVETFVDQHYADQVKRLANQPALHALRNTLLVCHGDEVAHRDEAAAAVGPGPYSFPLRLWCWLIGAGSRAAVTVCRRV